MQYSDRYTSSHIHETALVKAGQPTELSKSPNTDEFPREKSLTANSPPLAPRIIFISLPPKLESIISVFLAGARVKLAASKHRPQGTYHRQKSARPKSSCVLISFDGQKVKCGEKRLMIQAHAQQQTGSVCFGVIENFCQISPPCHLFRLTLENRLSQSRKNNRLVQGGN